MLHLDDQYRNQLNFKALKRYDSTIVSILYVCSHAALYRIKEGTRDWARKGIEGPLIVFERSVEPRFGLFVLNRLNTVNLSLYFTRDLQYEITDRFVMYRNQDMEVCCLWTYNEADIQALSAVFSRHCKSITQQPPQQPAPQHYNQSKIPSRIVSNRTSRLQNTNHFKNKKAMNVARKQKIYPDSDSGEEAYDNQIEPPRSSSRGYRDNSTSRQHSYDPSVSLQQYGEFQKPSVSKHRYQSLPAYPQSPPRAEVDLAKKSRDLLSLLQGSAPSESPRQFIQSPNQLHNDIDSKGRGYGDPTPSDLTWILNEFHNFTRNHPHFANDQAINNRNQFARAFGVFLASNDVAANKLHAMYKDMFE